MSSAQMPTAAFPQLGRYQIVQKLGEGGMGAVYLAEDTQLGRQVAVKILPPHSVNNPDAVARFQREARALAKLSHPNIIQAHDAGAENGQYFLVMEYVEGHSLAALLRANGPLSSARAATYIHQAAQALEHAHDKGLIHRDLKPSNLLLTTDGQVKLLDLGLSRFLQDQLGDASRTREGVGMGTPDYAPPEQFRDAHAVDHRADIYSLGCTLYELLAGRVPFPGTSLSEKYKAHATQEPPSLEAHGVDAPGGLVLVMQKMMAKNPADRYASARAVADDLLPHVSASSSSFQALKTTGSWHVGQLTMPEIPQRRRWLPWALVGVVSLAAAVLLALLLTGVLRPGTQSVAQGDGDHTRRSADTPNGDDKTRDDDKHGEPKPEGNKASGTVNPAPAERDPNILTVSQEEKDGGQYRTIGRALAEVKKGQTIRVLDATTYEETLLINKPATQAGIRLEAPRGAALQVVDSRNLLTIDGVPDVTVCNITFLAAKPLKPNPGGPSPRTFIKVVNGSTGVVLERLRLRPPHGSIVFGVEMYGSLEPPKAGAPPYVVRDCTFADTAIGVWVFGCFDAAQYHTACPIEGVRVENNHFEACDIAVSMMGAVRRIQIVGNRIAGSAWAGIHLENMLPGCDGVLVANNTLLNNQFSLRVWDERVRGKDVWICNNLMLRSKQLDMVVADSGGRHESSKGPGDGPKATADWRFAGNWREFKRPQSGPDPAGWIPPSDRDTLRAAINDVERDPKSPDFLRPAKDSDLATKAAGSAEPSLPRYVGAVPPEGVEPWDWERTWLAWPGTTKLLTVSKDDKGGGQYRSLNDALEKAKPWDTIRVLDGETYRQPLTLNNAARQTGLRLEATAGATLHLGASERRALLIQDVPDVRVEGFHFTGEGPFQVGRALILVTGKTPGLVLDGLEFRPKTTAISVFLTDIQVGEEERPVVVRRCLVRPGIDNPHDGIAVIGSPGRGPSRCIRIEDNRIEGALRGIWLGGRLQHIHVTGNRMVTCVQTGLQIEDLAESSGGLLLANNTCAACRDGFRLHTNTSTWKPVKGQVALRSNLFLDCTMVDVGRTQEGEKGQAVPGTDGEHLLETWQWGQNHRDFSGAEPKFALPQAAADAGLNVAELNSLDPNRPDALTPVKDSALATKGAGLQDAGLPVHVGAAPAGGTAAWNWDWTWSARRPREEPPKKVPADEPKGTTVPKG